VELLLHRTLPVQLANLLLRRLEAPPDLLPQLVDREILKVSLHSFDIIIYVHHAQPRLERTERMERGRTAILGTVGPDEEGEEDDDCDS
jgi:hypothetical protein